MEYVATTCPRDCYDGCGIIVRSSSSGVRVEGAPGHPVAGGALCKKCAEGYNTIWQDPAERLTYPLLRSRPDKLGGGFREFARVSWEEAIRVFCAGVEGRSGSEIMTVHYTGTCGELGGKFPERLLRRMSVTEVIPDTICNNAGHTALSEMFGTSSEGFDFRELSKTEYLIVWGANPAVSAPRTFSNVLTSSGTPMIVVDPVATLTAETALMHFRVRPGGDAALAFSLLNVLRQMGALDYEFIRNWTHGFAELEAEIASATPELLAEHTGITAQEVWRFADTIASRRCVFWFGQALQRQLMGGNVLRSCALLPVLTGNLGRRGCGFYFLNGTRNLTAPAAPDLGQLRGWDYGERISHMDLGPRLNDRRRTKAVVVWNSNPMTSSPDQNRLRTALQRRDLFVVVIDLFLTDTARFADLVLPAASFLESNDLVFNYCHFLLGAQVRARDPLGESLPNTEIFRRLAANLGFEEPPLHAQDDELISSILRGVPGAPSFQELASNGWMWLSEESRVQFGSKRFPTESGKIELIKRDGDRTVGPTWRLCQETPKGWFRVLTPASEKRLNSIFGNYELVKSESIAVTMSRADALRLDIREGESVALVNDEGSVRAVVTLSDKVPRGVMLSEKGVWPRLAGGRTINSMNRGLRTDEGQSNAVHSVEVRLERRA